MRNLYGRVFGRLTAVQRSHRDSAKRWFWKCVCTCDNFVVIRSDNLTGGNSRSCGCFNSDEVMARSTTHGQSRTVTYYTWRDMKTRCHNKNSAAYPDYGGRGITICDRWASFENFLSDMGERPVGLSLDRKDVNGNYEPSNCRWATRTEQNNNTRRTAVIGQED